MIWDGIARRTKRKTYTHISQSSRGKIHTFVGYVDEQIPVSQADTAVAFYDAGGGICERGRGYSVGESGAVAGGGVCCCWGGGGGRVGEADHG